jgi:catalase
MTEEQANRDYYMNPFDVTKVWSHADYPLIDVGVLELNQNSIIIFDISSGIRARTYRGIGYSPDKMCKLEFCRILMHNAIVWDELRTDFGE